MNRNPRTAAKRVLLGIVLAAVSVFAAACEKPDASYTTSPSALTLLGTTTGTADFAPTGTLPGRVTGPGGWEFDIGNARFSKLEYGDPAIQVVMQMRATKGGDFELWLARDGVPVVLWRGGTAHSFDGALCFQIQLEHKTAGEAVTLGPGSYELVLAFRDTTSQKVIAAQKVPVVGTLPALSGETPKAGSRVFRDLLGCPRSVV